MTRHKNISVNRPVDLSVAATVPSRLAMLPSYRGMHVPYFVGWFLPRDKGNVEVDNPRNHPDAVPDFRVVSSYNIERCRRGGVCWICGGHMGAFKSFVFGPLSAIHRISAEPPSHRACAAYAMVTCPHMMNPGHAHDNAREFPAGTAPLEHIAMLADNPGVFVMWTTRTWRPYWNEQRLIAVGEPSSVDWWTQGRHATRAEALDAIERAVDKAAVQYAATVTRFDRPQFDLVLRAKKDRLLEYLPD